MMRKVRIGAIGAGWWATTNHFPILARRDDVELVGVSSMDPSQAVSLKERFGFNAFTDDYMELLTWGVDAVVITTPHHVHYEHASAALAAGAAVMLEKPMTLDTEQAWDLVRRSEAAHLPMLIPYGWNYAPFAEEARSLLAVEGVGAIEHVHVRMASPTKNFFSAPGSGVPSNMQGGLTGPDPATWQNPRQGGGYLHGQLTHAAALLFWLTDLKASSVQARTSRGEASVDLYNSLLIEFLNGAHGTITGSATLPDNNKFQLEVHLFGTEGVLLLDVERERVELRRHDGSSTSLAIPAGQGAYECVRPVERFIDLVQGAPVANNSDARVGARTVEVLVAAATAAATRSEVLIKQKWSDLNER